MPAATAQVDRDLLTGLPSRRALFDIVDSGSTLFLVDVVEMKAHNCRDLEEAGDNLLRTLAQRLTSAFPKAAVFRAGGDEFLVAVPKVIEEDAATRIAEQIVELAAEPIEGVTEICRVTVGVSLSARLQVEESNVLEQIKEAEVAQFAARVFGRSFAIFGRAPVTEIVPPGASVLGPDAPTRANRARIAPGGGS